MLNPFRFARSYVGPVRAVILDWSGTTVDKYVIAPAVVFKDVFEKFKVPISMAESREPMGLRKDLHIKAITEMPAVRERWKSVHGNYPSQSDVDAMFKDFVPMQIACLKTYSELIPGAKNAVDSLRNMGCKIGVTTGFTRSMVDVLLAEAKKQGFVPDCNVAGDEVANGARPKPFMVYKNLDILDVPDIASVVKVDDTVAGVGEALSAGCWGVGVARHSNYMDINTLDEEDKLPQEEIERRLAKSRHLLVQTGAHYVIDTIKELPGVVEDINRRLASGEQP